MKNDKRKSRISFTGYLTFFGLVALIITIAVLISSILVANIHNNAIIAAIMFAVIVALTTFCTVCDWVRRKYMVDKPVGQILDATDKIANGNFNIELKPLHAYAKYDAYDLIMENLNKMAKELSRNEVLKTDFISNVSHEIKTPLAVINNHATLLQDKHLSEKERNEYTENLLAATRRLTDLVMNILKLNKLENQVIQEQKNDVHLGDYLGEIILGFEEMIDGRGIELNCDIDDITLAIDKTFFEIICNNLISNAIKFTEQGGNVTISLKDKSDMVELKVQDTGCGMDAETGKHIFDKFYQGDTSHSQQGNGLGLALVKKVIDIMGGNITVESELDKGSTFIVKLKK